MTKKSTARLAILAAFAAAGVAQASPQKFANSYEAKTLSKGQFEFENNVLWDHSNGVNGFEFEHEIEFGITDNFQISLLAEWSTEHVSGEGSESAFGKAGIEAIYQLSNPASDPLGSALLGEVAIGDKEFSLEGKLLLSKDAGPFTAVYNIGIEGFWEGSDYSDASGEFTQTAGLTYAISQQLFLGAELTHSLEIPDWSGSGANSLKIGPSLAFRAGNFWAALSAGWEVTNEEDASDFSGKIRFGFVF